MKRTLLLFFSMMAVTAFSQRAIILQEIPNKSYVFISKYPKDTQIYLKDSSQVYVLDTTFAIGSTMNSVFTSGKYHKWHYLRDPGTGTTAQYLRGDNTWQILPAASWSPWDTTSSGNYVQKNLTKKVGIGTTNPTTMLKVVATGTTGAISATSTISSALYGSATDGTGAYGYSQDGTGAYGYSVTGKGVQAWSGSGTAGYFATGTGKAGIFMGGNVGLNTIYPYYRLHNIGTTWLDSLLFVRYMPWGSGSERMVVWDSATNQFKKRPIPTGTTYTATSPLDITASVISLKPDTLTNWWEKQNKGAVAYSWGNWNGHTQGISTVTGLQDSLTNKYTKGQADGLFEPKISIGTTGQYWRGDKSWQTLPTVPANTVTGTGVSGYLTRFTGANTVDSSKIHWNGNGLAIGMTNTTAKLELSDSKDNGDNGILKITGTGSSTCANVEFVTYGNKRGLFQLDYAGNFVFRNTIGGLFFDNSPNTGKGIYFRTTGSNLVRMFIKSTGEIGIGTVTPSAKVYIASKKTAPLSITTDNDGGMGDSTAMYINAAADVGIGTTNITAQLTVDGDIACTGGTSTQWNTVTAKVNIADSSGNAAGNYVTHKQLGAKADTNNPSFSGTMQVKRVLYKPGGLDNAVGDFLTVKAKDDMDAGTVCYMGADQMIVPCAASSLAGCPYAMFLVTADCLENEDIQAMTEGQYHNATWSWTVGKKLYCHPSTPGGLTETIPTMGSEVILPVAVALTANMIYFTGNLNPVVVP